MNMNQAISNVFKNFATFEGRARRSEYWYFMLFLWLVNFVVSVMYGAVDYYTVSAILSLWNLAMLIPSMAVCWRRLHDTGRSGVYWLFNLIPVAGQIILIIWCTEDSQPGDNIYGRNPKGYHNNNVNRYVNNVNPVVNTHLAVRCLSGPLQGQVYPISQQGLLFGTDVSCALRLPSNTPGISRQHCAIRWQQGVPVLVDLNSSYGTCMANGKRLPPNFPERISAGTRFYLGGWGVLFEIVNL